MKDSTNTPEPARAPTEKKFLEQASALIALIGSSITIALTYANSNTKADIDRADQELKQRAQQIDSSIREREQSIQENKAKVERLRWVFDSLVPAMTGQKSADLSEHDVKRRTAAATAMIRLALDDDQAQSLLAGLEQSQIPEIKSAAVQIRKDIVSIDTSEVTRLIDQVSDTDREVRRGAVNRLLQAYPGSSLATILALDRLDKLDAPNLNSLGLVNLLYYLARTDRKAWTPENIESGLKILPKVAKSGREGNRWKTELNKAMEVIKRSSVN